MEHRYVGRCVFFTYPDVFVMNSNKHDALLVIVVAKARLHESPQGVFKALPFTDYQGSACLSCARLLGFKAVALVSSQGPVPSYGCDR